jgi:uncharacterized protein
LQRKFCTIFLFLTLAAALWGCGKKGAPVALESTVPGPVSDLRGWAKADGIYLNWGVPSRNTDNTLLKDLVGFRIRRQPRPLKPSACPDCPLQFEVIAEIDMGFPQGARVEGKRIWWQDNSLKPGTEYIYGVIAYNRYRTLSPESNRVRVCWDQPPAPVENVNVKTEDRALEIRWDYTPRLQNGEKMTDPGGFNVYRRGEGENFGFFPINPEPVPQGPYRDGLLVNGKRYEYVVRALRNFQGTPIESSDSPIVSGIPEKRTPPSAPTGLVAVMRKEEGKKGAELRWNQNPEPDIAGYDVYRQEIGTEAFVKVNSQLIREPYFFDSSADPRKSYSYRIRAVDNSPSKNQSDFSQEAEVNP